MGQPEGWEPQEGRLIIYAHDDGKIYAFSILDFVVLQTARVLQRQGIPPEEITPEMVSANTVDCTEALIEDGWFTHDEYVSSWAAGEVESVDKELEGMEEE